MDNILHFIIFQTDSCFLGPEFPVVKYLNDFGVMYGYNIEIEELDPYNNAELAKKYHIDQLPTVILYDEVVLVGPHSFEDVVNKIQNILVEKQTNHKQ